MTFNDVRDLFAFMKTLPAVQGKVREHDVPFPFNIRRSLGGWKFLFFDDQPFKPDPTKSAAWNRGAYLVNGPRIAPNATARATSRAASSPASASPAGRIRKARAGSPTSRSTASRDWTEDDFAYLLETGQTPDGDFVGGEMVAVIRNTSQLSDADRKAMAAYLKSLPPVEGPPKPAKKKAGS